MAMITVRNLPEEVHRAWRVRAAGHGRSTEAEVRAILEEAVKPQGRLKLGSLLADIGRQVRLTDEEVALIDQRNKSFPHPARAPLTSGRPHPAAAGAPPSVRGGAGPQLAVAGPGYRLGESGRCGRG